MQQTKNLILLDINSHLHRAYNRAYGLLKNTDQVPHINSLIQDSVNLIENELTKLQRQGITTDYIACIIDANGKNFRHELYEEYKANRQPTPEDFKEMRNEVLEILQLKGYFLIQKDKVEADDVIATLSKKANKVPNLNVVIGSRDKDLFYLINDKTRVFDGAENRLYDREGCIEKKGVPPEKILDYLTINGDQVDNISGIPDLGDKTIPRILEKYSVEDILKNPEVLADKDLRVRKKDKIITYIKENKDFIKLMQKLVNLKEDLELGVSLKHFAKKYENTEELNNKLTKLRMKR